MKEALGSAAPEPELELTRRLREAERAGERRGGWGQEDRGGGLGSCETMEVSVSAAWGGGTPAGGCLEAALLTRRPRPGPREPRGPAWAPQS